MMDYDFREHLLKIIDSKLASLPTEYLFLVSKFVTYYDKFTIKDILNISSFLETYKKE